MAAVVYIHICRKILVCTVYLENTLPHIWHCRQFSFRTSVQESPWTVETLQMSGLRICKLKMVSRSYS